jgi:hypothetical protein
VAENRASILTGASPATMVEAPPEQAIPPGATLAPANAAQAGAIDAAVPVRVVADRAVTGDVPSRSFAIKVVADDVLRAEPLSVQVAPSVGGARATPGRRVVQRGLEIIPGLVSWALILSPLLLSFRFPEIVAWFVLTFDFYWLYKAVVLTASVCVTFGRMRRTMAADWRTRALGLADPLARLAEIDRLVPRIRERVDQLGRAGERLAATGGRRELERLERERRDLARLIESGVSLTDPARIYHVALVPTYTEPFDKLYETVRALAEADYPRDRLMVAIITRETDYDGRDNVARLRDLFGDQFLHFFHILDPLEPGIVVGKSSAMAYGGRWLYRELLRLGFDPADVVVTDLDSDYRVHPQYFGYLTHTFLTEPDRYHRLFQPIPMFHNNLWQTPLPIRLVAVGATHVQMWRSLTPEKLISFSSYSVSLQTVHEVDYWATDAIPEDSRFYWKSFFRYSGEFRAVPLFIPMYGDAVRARSLPRTLVEQYTQIRRWAWGITDIPYYIRTAFAHQEIPRGLRVRRLIDLWMDHINWAIAPFVIIFGANLPLLLNPTFAQTTLGQNLPLYAAWLLTGAFCCLLILVFVEEQIAPPRPSAWSVGRRAITYLQWLALPAVGLVFSNLPALDAQTRLMVGKYLEYRVTEKA